MNKIASARTHKVLLEVLELMVQSGTPHEKIINAILILRKDFDVNVLRSLLDGMDHEASEALADLLTSEVFNIY